MPFVHIEHHPDHCQVLPRDFVPELAKMMPHTVAAAIRGVDPEEVRVDTKAFSPHAQNQPLVCVHVSLKAKPGRDDAWIQDIMENLLIVDISNLLQSVDPDFELTSTNDIHLVVDVVPRRFMSLMKARSL